MNAEDDQSRPLPKTSSRQAWDLGRGEWPQKSLQERIAVAWGPGLSDGKMGRMVENQGVFLFLVQFSERQTRVKESLGKWN